MKVGDRITVLGPNHGVATGIVSGIEPMKTRSGWNVTIRHDSAFMPDGYVLRPEDEGLTWIYGDDEAEIAALRVAEALWERTKPMQWERRKPFVMSSSPRKKDTP